MIKHFFSVSLAFNLSQHKDAHVGNILSRCVFLYVKQYLTHRSDSK